MKHRLSDALVWMFKMRKPPNHSILRQKEMGWNLLRNMGRTVGITRWLHIVVYSITVADFNNERLSRKVMKRKATVRD